jgi:hypothetical protein
VPLDTADADPTVTVTAACAVPPDQANAAAPHNAAAIALNIMAVS